MRSHLHLLSVLQLTWGAIMLMLGVSMGLLSLGAAAVGWTSPGAEISAALTWLVFAIFAAALLAGGSRKAGQSRWGSRSRTSSSSRSVLPWGFTLCGCSCTTRRAGSSSRHDRTALARLIPDNA